jgi:hypothetical protein
MDTGSNEGLRWSTASFGHSTDTSPGELSELGAHLQLCQAGSRGLRELQRGAQVLHGFVAPRFVSTLAVLAVAGGGFLLLL